MLTANIGGEFYNFGERGPNCANMSKWLLLASAPALPPVIPEPGAAGPLIAAASAGVLKRSTRK